MSPSSGLSNAKAPMVLREGGGACLLISKHDHFTPTREIKRQARNHPEGWKWQGHVSPTTTNYLREAPMVLIERESLLNL